MLVAVLLRSALPDLGAFIIAAIVLGSMYQTQPDARFFIERDAALSFPMVVNETISTPLLGVLAILFPCLTVALYAISGCERRHVLCRVSFDAHSQPLALVGPRFHLSPGAFAPPLEPPLASRKPGTLARDVRLSVFGRWITLLALAQSLMFTGMITTLLKVYIGRCVRQWRGVVDDWHGGSLARAGGWCSAIVNCPLSGGVGA